MRESELLQHVYQASRRLGADVVIGPGDDMAMFRLGSERLLVAVDQVIDGRHVRVDSTPLELVGRKAVTRSMSDIAAMAARPVASLVAVALPPGFGEARATQLFDAMRSTAAHYQCPLIGGDIAIHSSDTHPLTCSVTVLAKPATTEPISRSGARAGDGVYVTGALGGSLQPDGLGRHLTFEPRINEAIELARLLGDRLHAMIDISDGLGRDASHIAQMSGVRIEIDAAAVPCNQGLDWRRAVSDGEDYELCFTAGGSVPSRIDSLSVTKVGRIVEAAVGGSSAPGTGTSLVTILDGNQRFPGDDLGWDHRS